MKNKYMTEWKRNSIRIGAPTCILAAFTAFYSGSLLCAAITAGQVMMLYYQPGLLRSVLWCFLYRRADFLLRSPR